MYSAFRCGFPELTIRWIAVLFSGKWFGSAWGTLDCVNGAGCPPPESALAGGEDITELWAKKPTRNVVVWSGLCDFSIHYTSLHLGALLKSFGMGHTAAVDAGMELSSISAGESDSFAIQEEEKIKSSFRNWGSMSWERRNAERM